MKYEKPSVIGVREVPPVDKCPLTPVEFVQHWITMCGDFKDGKIEKSKMMKLDDLSADDFKYLVGAGISIDKIVTQYSTTKKELMAKFSSQQDSVSDQKGEIWFTDNRLPRPRKHQPPIVKVTKNVITLSSAFMQHIGNAKYVHLGITNDNQIKIKIMDNGLRIQSNGSKSATKRLSCAPVKRILQERGINIPTTFYMKQDTPNCWCGVIIDESD